VQVSNITRLYSTEQQEKLNSKEEVMLLNSQLGEYKSTVTEQQRKFDTICQANDDKLACLRRKYEAEVGTLLTSKVNLEEKLISASSGDLEKECIIQLDLLKAEFNQKLAEKDANTVDLRRQHNTMVHELNISKREAERLKDIVKARDSKIDHFKEQIIKKKKLTNSIKFSKSS